MDSRVALPFLSSIASVVEQEPWIYGACVQAGGKLHEVRRLILEGGRSSGSIGFNSDGSRLLAPRAAGEARVWSARTGRLLSTIPVPEQATLSAFSPDGGVLAILHRKRVTVRDVRSGKRLDGSCRLTGLDGPLGDRPGVLRVDRTGTLALAAADELRSLSSGDGSLIARPVVSDGRAALSLLKTEEREEVLLSRKCFLAICFSPDGNSIAASSSDGWLAVLNARDVGERWTCRVGFAVVSLQFSSCGSYLLGRGQTGSAVVLNALTGDTIYGPSAGQEDVLCSDFSADARLCCSGGAAGAIEIREVLTGKTVARLRIHESPILAVHFLGCDRVVSVSRDQVCLSSSSGELLGTWTGLLGDICPTAETFAVICQGASPQVRIVGAADGDTRWSFGQQAHAVSFSGDGLRLLVWQKGGDGAWHDRLYMFDATGGFPMGDCSVRGGVRDFANDWSLYRPGLSPDGKSVDVRLRAPASFRGMQEAWFCLNFPEGKSDAHSQWESAEAIWFGGSPGACALYRDGLNIHWPDAATGQQSLPSTERLSCPRPDTVAWSPDATLIVAGFNDGSLRIGTAGEAFQSVSLFEPDDDPIIPLAINRKRTRVLFAAGERLFVVPADFSAEPVPVDPRRTSGGRVAKATFSRSGRLAFILYASGEACVVSSQTGEVRCRFSVSGDPRRAHGEFSVRDKFLALASDDGALTRIDIDAGTIDALVEPDSCPFEAIAFSRDGQQILTVRGSDVVFWATDAIVEKPIGSQPRPATGPFKRPVGSAADLANLLGVKQSALVNMLQAPDKLRYRSFDIPKRSGGMRRIHAPGTELRVLQSRLFATIRDAYAPNASAHGFVPGRSIVSNASLHVGRRWVLNIDLRDFFPGISDIHVRDVFLRAPFSMGMEAAELAARICTRNNSLPQGAQTSPVLSNFVAADLDAVLVRLAEEYGLTYSRYADDITFSTDADSFPEHIAFLVRGEGGLRVAIAGSTLEAAITSSGFTIHPGKVRLHHTSQRQVVTGLSVNTRVNPSRAHMRRLRAMIHAWKKFGLEGAANEYFSRYADKKGRKRQQHRTADFRSVVYGYMAFIKMVRGAEDPALVAFSRELIRIDQKAPPRFVRHAVRSQNRNRRSDQDTAGVVEGADDQSSQSG